MCVCGVCVCVVMQSGVLVLMCVCVMQSGVDVCV